MIVGKIVLYVISELFEDQKSKMTRVLKFAILNGLAILTSLSISETRNDEDCWFKQREYKTAGNMNKDLYFSKDEAYFPVYINESLDYMTLKSLQ